MRLSPRTARRILVCVPPGIVFVTAWNFAGWAGVSHTFAWLGGVGLFLFLVLRATEDEPE